jgi:hypothetical protein
VAAVSGLAAYLISDPATTIPLWVVGGIAGLIGLVVISGAAYINAQRREQRVRRLEGQLSEARRRLVDMRELSRNVAQLIKEGRTRPPHARTLLHGRS